MFCPNCGKNCGDAKFCSECGQKLQSSEKDTVASQKFPPLNEPYMAKISGKTIDLHKVIRSYGTGIRKGGAYAYLMSEFGMSKSQAKQLLDPIYAAHEGEKVSFFKSFAASVSLQNEKENQERMAAWERKEKLEASGQAYCPKCMSTSITAQKKGYSVGKARLGGPLAGAVGSNEIQCICMKCGHKWEP